MASITEGIADLKMAVYLFHPSLNIVAKKYSEELRHHYKRNQFATKLLGFAKEATQDLQKDEFLLQIKSLGFSDYFVDRIYNDYLELNQLSPGLIDLIKTQLRDIIANSYLALAEQKQDNPVEYIKYVQSIDLENMTELQTLHSTKIRECNFSDVSTESIEDDIKNAVPSHWDPLNRTNPYKGLINGQITVVTAAPGVGKSLWLMNEAIMQLKAGRTVYYLAIGDLKESDFLIRMGSMILHCPLSDFPIDLEENKKRIFEIMPELNNLKLIFVDPGELTADELYDWLQTKGYLKVKEGTTGNTFMVDYDSNFAADVNASLYTKGDEVYSKLAVIASKPQTQVFVATQPKINFFNAVEFGEEGLGESSRKIHIPDNIITIGLERSSVNPVGIVTIAKQRRGMIFKAKYFRDIDGTFIEINDNDYNTFKNSPNKLTIRCGKTLEATQTKLTET